MGAKALKSGARVALSVAPVKEKPPAPVSPQPFDRLTVVTVLKRLAQCLQPLSIKELGFRPYTCNKMGRLGDGRADMEKHSSALKVMVIDDSKTIRRTAETLLKNVGCEVITAIDGFDALAKIVDHHPHIIFVDIMMPRLDGYQTCALIKSNRAFKSIPVIMLSSKDGLFDKAKGRIVGSDQFLTKPFSRDELLSAIKAHVPAFTITQSAQ